MICSVVGVFVQDTRIFFMNTDSILNLIWISIAQVEGSIEITYCSLTITSERQRIGHKSSTIFSQVEGMFASMREFGTSIRNNHLSNRQTPEQGTNIAMIIIGDIVQDNTF